MAVELHHTIIPAKDKWVCGATELTFPQVSTLFDLKNCQSIYNESNRPDTGNV